MRKLAMPIIIILVFCLALNGCAVVGALPAIYKGLILAKPLFALALVALGKDGDIIGYSSGFVLNKKMGLIVTAKHVIEAFGDNLNARIGSKYYPSACFWKHSDLDIGIVRVDPETLKDMTEVKISPTTLPPDKTATLVGFQYEKKNFCQRIIPFNIISNSLSRIRAQVYKLDKLKDYHGLNGGVLLNELEQGIGIFIGTERILNILRFVPLHTIPDRFLPNNNDK